MKLFFARKSRRENIFEIQIQNLFVSVSQSQSSYLSAQTIINRIYFFLENNFCFRKITFRKIRIYEDRPKFTGKKFSRNSDKVAELSKF